MPQLTLTGEFVELVPLTTAHAARTLAWRQGDRAVFLNQGAATLEQQTAWIAGRPASEYNFVIRLKSAGGGAGAPSAAGPEVGMVSVIQIDTTHGHCETARFLIGEEDAVRGIPAAVEAMKLVYELVFDRLQLQRVFGTVASDNTLMIKWQKFLGMKEEGRLRRHYFIQGHHQDAVCLGMLADEYRTQALPRMNALIAAGRKQAATHKVNE